MAEYPYQRGLCCYVGLDLPRRGPDEPSVDYLLPPMTMKLLYREYVEAKRADSILLSVRNTR